MNKIIEDLNGTTFDSDLIDQLIHEFITKCNYVRNAVLEENLRPFALKASYLCQELKVDPGTYVDAHIMFAPILKGYFALTPPQLHCSRSKQFVTEYISQKRDISREFEVQFRLLGQCLEAGWSEKLCLSNPTIDFFPWFRILISSVKDEELIKNYGYNALQILSNDKPLVDYLKTVKSDNNEGLDFSRIPGLKL